MDIVSKDLVSQASSQWLRSPVSEHILMFPPKKSQSSLSTCVSTRFLWIQFFRIRSFFFPIAFQSLQTRESNTWLISLTLFPLSSWLLQKHSKNSWPNVWNTFSFVWFYVFTTSPHQSLLSESLQMTAKMKCQVSKPGKLHWMSHCCLCSPGWHLCNPWGEGWDLPRGASCAWQYKQELS